MKKRYHEKSGSDYSLTLRYVATRRMESSSTSLRQYGNFIKIELYPFQTPVSTTNTFYLLREYLIIYGFLSVWSSERHSL